MKTSQVYGSQIHRHEHSHPKLNVFALDWSNLQLNVWHGKINSKRYMKLLFGINSNSAWEGFLCYPSGSLSAQAALYLKMPDENIDMLAC